MLKHNLLIIFRNFKRNKSSFFINLIGLSTGLACALMIYLWVNDELNFDRFHEKDSQLFLVMQNWKTAKNIDTFDATPGLLPETLSEEMPEVEYATAVFDASILGKPTLSVKDKNIKAHCLYAGKEFFNIFSFNLIDGKADHVLTNKNSVVISEELAMKLFNTTQNVVGKMIEFDHNKTFLVSGIFKKVPSNSTLQFDFVLAYDILKKMNPKSFYDWGNNAANTYVILKQGTDIKKFNDKIAGLIERKSGDAFRTLFLTPFSGKYLYSTYQNGVQTGGRIEYVELFSIIAIFILVIACINFMNLSTARASGRMKEIGMKKALGADRKSLVIQHLGESVLITVLSLTIAIILIQFFLPRFNEITGKHIILNLKTNIIFAILGITLFTGLIAGSYPALYLSGFNPVAVLKGNFNSSIGELWIRKGLVVFQFVLSGILIVAVLVVSKQTDFIQNKKLGYNKDNIIYFDMEGKVAKNKDAFISEVKNIPGIVNASSSGFDFLGNQNYTPNISWEGKNPDDITMFKGMFVNYGFIETFGIEMAKGRPFSRDFGSDNSKIILNETAVKLTGFKDPVGKVINLWGHNWDIIGVTKDFHFESLHKMVNPLFFVLAPPNFLTKVMIKIKSGTEKETINRLRTFYETYNPGYVFEYRFLDEDYQAQYAAEKRVAMLSRYFAGIAIIISCLGLFGLVAFTAERRRKEIGIRKALGSSAARIVFLLSGDFTKIVLASMLIAFPVSYFIIQNWLDSFAYRIDLQVWYFVCAGLITLFIAWITVGVQAIKAALANPVETLRYE